MDTNTTPVIVKPGFPVLRMYCVHREQIYLTPRDRILHAQTHRDDPSQTFVAFLGAKDDRMFATVDVHVGDFFELWGETYDPNEDPNAVPTDDVDVEKMLTQS